MQISEEKKLTRKKKMARIFSILAFLMAFVIASFILKEAPMEAHAMNNAQTPAVQIVELNNVQLSEYGIMNCMWQSQEEVIMEQDEGFAVTNNAAWDLMNYTFNQVGEESYLTINNNTEISIHTENDEGINADRSLIQLFYYNTVREALEDVSVGTNTLELTLFVNNNSTVDLAQFIPNNALIYKLVAYYQVNGQDNLDWYSLSNYNFYYYCLENIERQGDNGRDNVFVEYSNINYNTELDVAYATISNFREVFDNTEFESGVYTYTQIPLVFSGATRIEFTPYSNAYYTSILGDITLETNNFVVQDKVVDAVLYEDNLSSGRLPSLLFTDGSTYPLFAGAFTINNPQNIIVSSSSAPINNTSLEGALIDSPLPNVPYTPYQITKANTVWYEVAFRSQVRDLTDASSTLRDIIDDIAELIKDRAPQLAGAGIGGLIGWLGFGPFGLILGIIFGWLGLSGLGNNFLTSLFNRFTFLPYVLALGFIVFVVLAVINLIRNRR